MTRRFRIAAAAGLAVAVAQLISCRTSHLGNDTGRVYHQAFAAQREAPADNAPALTADDAKRVLQVHAVGPSANSPAADSEQSALGSPMGAGGLDTTSISGGAWEGASGNITLDAK